MKYIPKPARTIALIIALGGASLVGCGGGGGGTAGVGNGSVNTTNPTSTPSSETAIPVRPAFTPVANTDTSILLTWDVDPNATSYVITRNGTKIAASNITIRSGTASFIDNGLTPVTTYTYTVQACGALGCSSVGTAAPISTLDTQLAIAIATNNKNFFTSSILLANLPDLPANIASFAATPYNSYAGTTGKGNDAWSTKRLDLINWYNAIRNGDNSVWKEYTGSTPVYAEVPKWVKGGYSMGVLSKGWQTNALDFYNFARALFGAQWVYMSGYKQVAAQVAAMSNLNGSHGPTESSAIAVGMGGAMYTAIYAGRSSSNLMGGAVNTTANYSALTSLPVNAKLASIWNESESGRIAGLGHRTAFMYAPGRDIGIGGVLGYYTWMAYGASPAYNDGELLGGASQTATYNSWPVGPTASGVQAWPSHGYFPFFMLAGSNQAWSTRLYGDSVSSPAKGEVITLKMEYFVHAQDGDLSSLINPVKTITLTDVMGVPNSGSGPVNPATGVPDYVNAEMIPNGGTGPQFLQGGGYYFTTTGSSLPFAWRMPQDWYTAMSNDFKSASPSYHTVRMTISSNGSGFKVLKPFYMNPTLGAPLVIQTTFFDIQRQTGIN